MQNFKIPESVLVVIHTPDLDVLLIQRTGNPDFWQSVTGSKDTVHEALLHTAVREVMEETGISMPAAWFVDWALTNVYEIYPAWRHRYAPDVSRNTEHLYSLCVPRGTVIQLSPLEHTAFKWLPYLEAADLCFSPSNAEALLMLPQFLTPSIT